MPKRTPAYPKPTCLAPDCREHVFMDDLCVSHWNAATDPTATGLCSVDGCWRKLKTGALCSGHAERRRKTGIVGGPLLRRLPKEGECAFKDCGRPVNVAGLCNTHYKQKCAGQALEPITIQARMTASSCTVDGCGGKVTGRTWCSKHYQHWQNHGHPTEKTGNPGKGACSYPGCKRPRRQFDLCRGHYEARWKGKPLAPLQRRVKNTERDAEGRKQCRGCEEWLHESNFTISKYCSDGLYYYCSPCSKASGLLSKFGLTREMYDGIIAAQGGGCAICGRPEDESPRGLYVDHDHACCPDSRKTCGECVRGILCHYCNAGIGMLQDSRRILLAAEKYIAAWEAGADERKSG